MHTILFAMISVSSCFDSSPSAEPAVAPVEPGPAPQERPAVRQVGQHFFVISRDTLHGMLDASASLGWAQSRSQSNGGREGWRLSAVRRNTMAEQMGLKSGDTVLAIGGVELSSMTAAMRAYREVWEAEDFCLSLLRGGKPMELCYSVR
jgi:S1-C subfamily serine protease